MKKQHNIFAKNITDKGIEKAKLNKLVEIILRNQYFEKGITYNKKRFSLLRKTQALMSLQILNRKDIEGLLKAYGVVPKDEEKKEKDAKATD
jgi:hypothetical protein